MSSEGLHAPRERLSKKTLSMHHAIVSLMQVTGEVVVVAPDPLDHHRRVLHLLAHVVQQDFLQLGILAVVGTLLVPVHGLELLHERDDGAVHVARLGGQLGNGFVIALVGQGEPSFRSLGFESS